MSYLVYLNGIVASQLYFFPYLVMRWPWPLTLKFSKMLNTTPIRWIKVCTLYIWMEFWLQNWIYAHISSCSDLDVWPSTFRNTWHYSKESVSLPKFPTWSTRMELWLQSWIFSHISRCGDLDLWNPKSIRFIVLIIQVFTLPPNLKEIHPYNLELTC